MRATLFRRASTKSSTTLIALSPATKSHIRASPMYSKVKAILVPLTGINKLVSPNRGPAPFREPSKRKKPIPKPMSVRPATKFMMEPGLLKFLTTVRPMIRMARMRNSERAIASRSPVCVTTPLVWGSVRRAYGIPNIRMKSMRHVMSVFTTVEAFGRVLSSCHVDISLTREGHSYQAVSCHP